MTGKQSDAFMEGEGQAWLRRNINKLTKKGDPVLEALKSYNIKPKIACEIGAANGWRLDAIAREYGCHAVGVDPAGYSQTEYADVIKGTAENLWYGDNAFDLVIYGWCLYLCDPENHFRIVAEGDRVLKDDGFLVVYDFCSEKPYKVKYKHKPGLFSYHYDFSKLWLAHPSYSLYARTVQDHTCVTILKKNAKDAFPEEP